MSMTNKETNGLSRHLLSVAILSSLGAMAESTLAATQTLEEVIVTAQKREQSLQEVPVAVTALTQDALEVNKVLTVNDLSGLAPGLTVRPAAGGTNIPSFNMRGITSYGVVPGSDKQISTYLDGVYIGSPRGAIFNLPDIQQLEVLRGPQGTLFGRNATGGAVNVRTRDPDGEFGITQVLGFGNLDAFSSRTTIDFPAMGPLSAYVSYAMEERDGAVDNTAAGTAWDRSAFGVGVNRSPETLGEVDNDSLFLAARLDLDAVTLTYKYDRSTDEGTPRASAFTSDPSNLFAGLAFAGITITSPVPEFGTSRPDKVENAWSTNRDQTVEGHSLVAEWEINDTWTLKNTLAYRESEVNQAADIGGGSFEALVATPFGTFPGRFCLACSFSLGTAEQTSNEVQLNFDGENMTGTFGALYYDSEDWTGGNTFSGAQGIFIGQSPFVINNTNRVDLRNDSQSQALYGHIEYELTDELSVQAGVRQTWDEKTGDYTYYSGAGIYRQGKIDYKDDQASYLLGATYRMTDNMMVYGKWSTAYVSGGVSSGYEFKPEDVESFEIGMKADFMDGRLRTNVALFDVTYDDLQSSQNGATVAAELLALDPVKWADVQNAGTFIVQAGTLEAQGVELEVTALPLDGLTVSASLSYVDSEYTELSPELMAIDDVDSASDYDPTLTAPWSGTLGMNYASDPLFGTAYLSAGFNAVWTDKIRFQQESTPTQEAKFKPETWVVNARIALKEISLTDSLTGEVALWGRNLLDEDTIEFPLGLGPVAASTYMDPRTYGIEFRVDFN